MLGSLASGEELNAGNALLIMLRDPSFDTAAKGFQEFGEDSLSPRLLLDEISLLFSRRCEWVLAPCPMGGNWNMALDSRQ